MYSCSDILGAMKILWKWSKTLVVAGTFFFKNTGGERVKSNFTVTGKQQNQRCKLQKWDKFCCKAALKRQTWRYSVSVVGSVQFDNCRNFIHYETNSIKWLAALLKTVLLLFSLNQFSVESVQSNKCRCNKINQLCTNSLFISITFFHPILSMQSNC